jgi:hypothetical protein
MKQDFPGGNYGFRNNAGAGFQEKQLKNCLAICRLMA